MADTLRIYHNKAKDYDKELKRLQKESISARNKALITEFTNYLFARGCSRLRVSKLSSQLRRICRLLKKDFDKATKQDIQGLIAQINQSDKWSAETINDYRRCVKQFYSHFEDIDERFESEDKDTLKEAKLLYKYIAKEIRTTIPPKSIDYSEIITDDEINKVVDNGCRTIKEKAYLKMLHETGCRAGEFLNIKLKHLQLHKNRALVAVDGKTGERRIPIVHSLPLLMQWLNVHPYRNNKESYLWLGERINDLHRPMMHRGGQKLIERCFTKAGFIEADYAEAKLESGKVVKHLISKKVHKKHNFHWFRHSRATLLAPRLTESLLCKYMGWQIGSRQVRRYVHLCVQQLEDAILQANGLKNEESKEAEKPQVCNCGTINTSTSRYCYQCGNPLSVTTALQDQERISQQTDARLQAFAEIMSDPAKRAKYEEFKKIMLAGSDAQ